MVILVSSALKTDNSLLKQNSLASKNLLLTSSSVNCVGNRDTKTGHLSNTYLGTHASRNKSSNDVKLTGQLTLTCDIGTSLKPGTRLSNSVLRSNLSENQLLRTSAVSKSALSAKPPIGIQSTSSTHLLPTKNKLDLNCHRCLGVLEDRATLIQSNLVNRLTATSSSEPSKLVETKALLASTRADLSLLSNARKSVSKENRVEDNSLHCLQSDLHLPAEKGVQVEKPLFPVVEETDEEFVSPVAKLDKLKNNLINTVSGALIAAPNFTKPDDAAVINITGQLDLVSQSVDPEFILKLALYSRVQLNLRTVSNYLLAYSAQSELCRPFLKRYFKKSVVLPTDWIEIAELYQNFVKKETKHGMVSAALRKALIEKFPDFDEYQLGKYNKQKRTKKVTKKTVRGKVVKVVQESNNAGKKKRFTLKQLIRMTHIQKPVNFVMAILGKRYPETPEEFNKLQMTGVFDSERVGKRMRLAVPETWETQVSARGNKAEVWQDLLDHNKLPFMAMLRNLRNLIKAGISEQHHKKVTRKLMDEKTIIRSKQFPFRFFSAFVALDDLMKVLEKAEKEKETPMKKPVVKKTSTKSNKKKPKFTKKPKPILFTEKHVAAYKKALGKSVKIATMYNVSPIPNKTLIFCDVSDCMYQPCTSARAFGQPKQMVEVGVLMGLMCQHACESSSFFVFHENGAELISLSKDNILERTRRVLELAAKASGHRSPVNDAHSLPEREPAKFPENHLWNLIKQHEKIDNLVVLSRDTSAKKDQRKLLDSFLTKYRRLVNPNLLFVNVDLSGASTRVNSEDLADGTEDRTLMHPNDICIAGFSEQLLQFISERGNTAQLQHVNAIDKAFGLNKIKVHSHNVAKPKLDQDLDSSSVIPFEMLRFNPVKTGSRVLGYRRVKIFISSTFKDMELERQLVVTQLMPQLRKKYPHVALQEIDLRWGVVTPDNSSSLAVCLGHVQNCDIFVGFMGLRYGFCPSEFVVPLTDQFDWLKKTELGKSITELEFDQARMLKKPMFVFVRNYQDDNRGFHDGEDENNTLWMQLEFRRKILQSDPTNTFSVCTYDISSSYVEDFCRKFESTLSDFIETTYSEPLEQACLDSVERMSKEQYLLFDSNAFNMVGRTQLLKDTLRAIVRLANSDNPRVGVLSTGTSGYHPLDSGKRDSDSVDKEEAGEGRGAVFVIKGDCGIGKTTFMASLISHVQVLDSARGDVCAPGIYYHFVQGHETVDIVVNQLMETMKRDFHLPKSVPQSFQEQLQAFPGWLSTVVSLSRAKRPTTPLVIFIDAVEKLNTVSNLNNLDWIPKKLPKGCVVVLGVDSGCGVMCKRAEEVANDSLTLSPLNVVDRRTMLARRLALFGKHLDASAFNNQLALLTSKRDASHPLYLAYACEYLRLFASYDNLSASIKAIPQSLSAFLEWITKLMEMRFGPSLVSASLLSLFLSPEGLREEDLRHILSVCQLVDCDLSASSTEQLQLAFCSRLSRLSLIWFSQLMVFLKMLFPVVSSSQYVSNSGQDDVLKVRSTLIQLVLEKKYFTKLDKNARRVAFNKLLAAYHMYRVQQSDTKWAMVENAPYGLILHHLQQGGQASALKDVLTDLSFVDMCFRTGNQHKLMHALNSTDFTFKFSRFEAKEFEKMMLDPKIEAMRNFVAQNLNVLTRVPSLLYQQASFDHGLESCGIDVSPPHADGSQPNGSFFAFHWLNCPVDSSKRVYTIDDLSAPVVCIDLCQGSPLLAVGIKDCRVMIFNSETAQLLTELSGFLSPVSAVKFISRDKLAIGSDGGQVELFATQDWHKIISSRGHDRKVASIACDPSGVSFATVGWDCCLKLWNVSDGKYESDIDNVAPCPINCVDWHPARPLLVIGCWDSTLKLWNTTSKTMEYSYRGHMDSVKSVVFTRPDGLRMLSSSLDGDIRLWSVGEKCALAVFDTVPNVSILNLCLAKEGRLLVGTGSDGQLRVWKSDLGKEIIGLDLTDGDLKRIDKKPKHNIHSEHAIKSLEFSHDRTLLATAHADGKIDIICVSSFKLLNSARIDSTHKAILQFVCWVELNVVIAVCENKLWMLFNYPHKPLNIKSNLRLEPCDVVAGQVRSSVRSEFYTSEKLTSAKLGSVTVKGQTSQVLALGTEHGNVELFKVVPSSVMSESSVSPVELQKLFTLQSAHEGSVTVIRFFHHSMFTAGKDRQLLTKICFWDMRKIKNGKGPVHVIMSAHNDWICSLDVSEHLIVSGSADNTVRVWNRGQSKGSQLGDGGALGKTAEGATFQGASSAAYTLVGHSSAVQHVKYFEEADLIVSCDSEGGIKTWKHSKGALLSSSTYQSPTHVALSALVCEQVPREEQRLDQVVTQGEIADWAAEVEKDEALQAQNSRAIPGETKPTSKVDIRLVVGYEDGQAVVCDPMVGSQISRLVGHSEPINTTAEQPTDNSIFSGANDRKLIKWTVVPRKSLSGVANKGSDVCVSAVDIYMQGSNRRVVIGDLSGCLAVFDYSSGQRLTVSSGPENKHHSGVVTGVWAFAMPQGSKSAGKVYLMSCGYDGKVNNFQVEESSNGSYGSIVSLEHLSTDDIGSPVNKLRKCSSDVDDRNLAVLCGWNGCHWFFERKISSPRYVRMVWNNQSPSSTGQEWKTDWLSLQINRGQYMSFSASLDMEHCVVNKLHTLMQFSDSSSDKHISIMSKSVSPHCVCFEVDTSTNKFLIGSSSGHVSYLRATSNVEDFKIPPSNSFKAHEEAVTCMKNIDQFLITAGDDCEIKVWRETSNLQTYQQVGQFTCQGPVSCLTAEESSVDDENPEKRINVAAADKMGNIYCISL